MQPAPHRPDRREGALALLLTVVLALACALMNVDAFAPVPASAPAIAAAAKDQPHLSRAAFSYLLRTRHAAEGVADEADLYTRYLAFIHDPEQVRAVEQRLRTDDTLRAIAARPHDPEVIALTMAWIKLTVASPSGPLSPSLVQPGAGVS